MTRSERKRHFERLIALRDAYRAEIHEGTRMTVTRAMRFAEQRWNDVAAMDLADAAAIEAALVTRGRAGVPG